MASKRKLAVNRRNAKKSTGPKTPEGRAAVRLNGLRHGFSSETEADFTDLLHSPEAEHHPATPIEEALVRELATSTWRLNRLYHFEASLDTAGLEKLTGRDSLSPSARLAPVADRDAAGPNNLSRIEARLEGSFHRVLQQREVKIHNQSQSQNRTLVLRP